MAENWWRTLLDNTLSNLIANIIIAAIGGFITAGVAVFLNLPPGYIFMIFVAGSCVFIGAAILWQQHKTSQRPPDDIDRWAQTPEKFYQKESQLKKWWWKRKKQPSALPLEFISMKEAATKLYTEARRCNSLMAAGAEQLSGWAHGQPTSGTVDDILDHVAGVIAGK